MFFGGRMTALDCWQNGLVVFFAFSLAASAVYCLNDLRDVDDDRKHPSKRLRPLASGRVSAGHAAAAMAACLLTSLGAVLTLPAAVRTETTSIVLAYIVLNVAYCCLLKYVAIVDVCVIAAGFVLRVVAGGLACSVWLSPWIIVMTFLLALFLAFAKRRDDVILHLDSGIQARKSARSYNLAFLDQTLGILAAVTIICYIMYTVQPEVVDRLHSPHLYLTAVFVIAGILRYLKLAMVDAKTGSPTRIMLTDTFIQLCVTGWLLTFAALLY